MSRIFQVVKKDYKGRKYLSHQKFIIYKYNEDCYAIDYDIELTKQIEDIKIIDGKEYINRSIDRYCAKGKELNSLHGKIEEIELKEIGFKIKFIDVELTYGTTLQNFYNHSQNSYANIILFLYEYDLFPKYISVHTGDNHSCNYLLLKPSRDDIFNSKQKKIDTTLRNMKLDIPLFGYGFNNTIYYSICLKHIIKNNFKGFEIFKNEVFKYLNIQKDATKEEIATRILEYKTTLIERENRKSYN